MGDDGKPQSWWQTLPGILTSATATITAVAGLIAVVHQMLPGKAPAAQPSVSISVAAPAPPPASAPTASPGSAAPNASAQPRIATGRFANRCGCWGFIKYGSTHPNLRCQSGLAVARKCVETCPNGDHAWHFECE
jgi:hypothetical protein